MERKDDEAPFPREPWQRLLEDSADGPPETTDARIRAAARRDLAPRGHRWWLPASLAASLVLAVMLVQSEFGSGGRVRIPQAERGGDAAMDARIIERQEGEQAREPGRSPAAPPQRPDKQREETDPDIYGYADSELGTEAAGTGPRVGGPEHELKSASELPDEIAAGERGDSEVRPDMPAPPPAMPAAAPEERAEAAALAAPPTPDAWYAAIEKLRAEGRIEEANRELERLKKAHPGWLEKHLARQRPR